MGQVLRHGYSNDGLNPFDKILALLRERKFEGEFRVTFVISDKDLLYLIDGQIPEDAFIFFAKVLVPPQKKKP